MGKPIIVKKYKEMIEKDRLYNLEDYELYKDVLEALALWFEYDTQLPEDVQIKQYSTLSEQKKQLLFKCLELPNHKKIHLWTQKI